MCEGRHRRKFLQRVVLGSLCLGAVPALIAAGANTAEPLIIGGTDTVVEPRIIGGTDAIDDGFAFAVQIRVDLGGTAGFCGGALLAPRWALTAGRGQEQEARSVGR